MSNTMIDITLEVLTALAPLGLIVIAAALLFERRKP
jgi:hypothetical protein